MAHICPACEKGRLEARTGSETIQYGDDQIHVEGIQFSECDLCGEEVVLPIQSKANALLYADAKKIVDGMLACAEIKIFREKWRLSQHDAAAIFGGGKNAFSKYERGEIIHSKSMDLLMRVFDEVAEARSYLSNKAGVKIEDNLDANGVAEWETVTVEPVSSKGANMSACMVFDFADFASAREGRGDWSPANESWIGEGLHHRMQARA
ncbi:type II toxin-antitoxin system MqsA family antitoxin [Xanthomonas phaseoli]|uniref:type II toxin-antitoxin system MqsA family antitoxin n=1 Tax=Xanthomonas phaseoli TaxID=1985254 RepID=UPI0009B682AD|nr:type II toxin-antitoxin system MqsA family antitoxin [Xanthomonas phaseoli]RWU12481.1 type II toxin-antitoxin system MqsA family antitoxin [Xanthomonas phaseoli pv. manihotis str. CIO151]UEQ13616.1 type II toxin-antitoxin system MqsA family antitoxin [Xanthomonas phaseoli pv. manihotis]